MVEDRLIMSVINIVSQFQSSTFGHNEPSLQHGLSAVAELLVYSSFSCLFLSFYVRHVRVDYINKKSKSAKLLSCD